MAHQKPDYRIDMRTLESSFSEDDVRTILYLLDPRVEVSNGHDLPLESRALDAKTPEAPIVHVRYSGAQVISLRPPQGQRFSDFSFYGEHSRLLQIGRIMDEATGGGACSSFHFDPQELGVRGRAEKPIDHATIDVYKLG